MDVVNYQSAISLWKLWWSLISFHGERSWLVFHVSSLARFWHDSNIILVCRLSGYCSKQDLDMIYCLVFVGRLEANIINSIISIESVFPWWFRAKVDFDGRGWHWLALLADLRAPWWTLLVNYTSIHHWSVIKNKAWDCETSHYTKNVFGRKWHRNRCLDLTRNKVIVFYRAIPAISRVAHALRFNVWGINDGTSWSTPTFRVIAACAAVDALSARQSASIRFCASRSDARKWIAHKAWHVGSAVSPYFDGKGPDFPTLLDTLNVILSTRGAAWNTTVKEGQRLFSVNVILEGDSFDPQALSARPTTRGKAWTGEENK